jgi:hypothetical protein
MRIKSSELKNIQLMPSKKESLPKAKGSLLELLKLSVHSKKKKKVNGVWMLVLSALVIALFALLRSKVYFG